MQHCKLHAPGAVIDTPERARQQVQWWLTEERFPKSLIAEVAAEMGMHNLDRCCAAAGYARYLMANAFRAMLNCRHNGMTRVDEGVQCDNCSRTFPNVHAWIVATRGETP